MRHLAIIGKVTILESLSEQERDAMDCLRSDAFEATLESQAVADSADSHPASAMA